MLAAMLAFTGGCSPEDEPNNGGNNNGGETPEAPTGAISGVFSINENGGKVYFSQGNLQYQASTDTWRFAEHQYDCIEEDNANISMDYSGWIDLFGWGTSGWDSGAVCYQPYSTSDDPAHYHPGGSWENDLTGEYANADWGVYCAISNGGQQAGLWRSLTSTEWDFILGDSPNRANKWGFATVDNRHGMVVLPDVWNLPNGLTFNSGFAEEWLTNVYTASDWARMEAAGALFLPAVGHRNDHGQLEHKGTHGNYWTSTANSNSFSYYVYFYVSYETFMSVSSNGFRRDGMSVRLVQDVD